MNRVLSAQNAFVLIGYVGTAALIAFFLSHIGEGWGGIDGQRFHAMAGTILAGLTPYVDFVDPKPPLLYFTIALMDSLFPRGSADTVVMTILNVGSALILWQIGTKDYGWIAGYSTGLLYLVSAVFVQGYFMFSEPFAVFLILCSYTFARHSHFTGAGISLGLACGFKQYALLAVIPLLLLMRAQNDRRYNRLVFPAIIMILSPFIVLDLVYGVDVMLNAFFWTYGIAPAYICGSETAGIPNYHSEDIIGVVIDLVASIAMVLPTLLFACASVAHRGLKTPSEKALGLFALLFGLTILIRQYLHYWILAMPFLALLACREFADDRPVQVQIRVGTDSPFPDPHKMEGQEKRE